MLWKVRGFCPQQNRRPTGAPVALGFRLRLGLACCLFESLSLRYENKGVPVFGYAFICVIRSK